jgi:hypothetical protein
MATGRRPDPPPLETDDRPAMVVGIAAWLVALVVLALFFRADLSRHHACWWLWSCGAGAAMGGYGYWFVSRRQRRRDRQE